MVDARMYVDGQRRGGDKRNRNCVDEDGGSRWVRAAKIVSPGEPHGLNKV